MTDEHHGHGERMYAIGEKSGRYQGRYEGLAYALITVGVLGFIWLASAHPVCVAVGACV